MEQVKINGLYIPIEDVENLYDGNKSHPFDHHPILDHYDDPRPSDKNINKHPLLQERTRQYIQEKHPSYDSSPHVDRFAESIAKLHESGALEGRGLEPGQPVHRSESQAIIDPERFASSKPTARRSKKTDLSSSDEDLSSISASQGVPQSAPAQPKTAPSESAKSLLPPHLHDLLKR
jgi:hypothetical protein